MTTNNSSRKVGVIIGSLRKEAFSGKTARALIELAPAGLTLEIIEIGQLPLYNQDGDDSKSPPAPWTQFRERLNTVDAILFVTPEHNRSMPAALKNAIDIASRPYGQNKWNGKPAAVVSVSPTSLGAFGANHHLRQSLVFVNVAVMAQPEAYVGGAANLFDTEGRLTNTQTREFLVKFMAAFHIWIGKILG